MGGGVPQPVMAGLDAARHLLAARRPELAERELRRWLAGNPQNAEGHALLAQALHPRDPQAALDAAREAVRLAPDWAYALTNLAWLHFHRGEYADAERAARSAVAAGPEYADGYRQLGSALLEQPSGADEALEMAERALALAPGDAPAARLRARALARLNRFSEARRASSHALSLDPEHPVAHTDAAHLAIVAGDSEAARTHLRTALRVNPNDGHTRAELGKVEGAHRDGAALREAIRDGAPALRGLAVLFALLCAAAAARGRPEQTVALQIVALPFLAILCVQARTGASRGVDETLLAEMPVERRLEVRVRLAVLLMMAGFALAASALSP